MRTSLIVRVYMLCVVLLMGAAALSARSTGATASIRVGRTTAIGGLATATASMPVLSVSLLSTLWDGGNTLAWMSEKSDGPEGQGNGNDSDDGNDGEGGGTKDHAPAPAPEPSTLLSFGIALAIGAGALFLRRIPGVRK